MQLEIEKLVFGGKGIGHAPDGKAVFVKKTAPGDNIDIELTNSKKNFSEGKITKINKPSVNRIDPICANFNECGGCDHQNIPYAKQLEYKSQIFAETLGRAKIDTEILPIIPGSDSEYFYRNTIRFYVIKNSAGYSFAMHDCDDFTKLVPIKKCYLQSKVCNEILEAIIYTLNQHTTLKNERHLTQLRLREGKFTGEFMLEFITKTDQLEQKDVLLDMLKKSFPEIKSCYHTIASNDALVGARRKLLYGSPIIYEKVGKFKYQISPESFFQTNSLGIKTLYDKIKEFAEIEIGETILDLYCGTGTIGIYLSTLAKKVTGVEIVQNAINDARANAKINNVCNTEFICADATKWLKQYSSSNGIKKNSQLFGIGNSDFDIIIIDPPREGLSKELILQLSTLDFQPIVYVSCNPTTFARDIIEFEKLGLKLKKVQPIDMFPQTHHIECIGLILRG